VTSQFPTFVSHHSGAFVQVIHLMVLVTQLTAVLHAEYTGLLATVSLTSAYVLRDSPDRVGARSSTVEALCYKLEGCGFDSQ
jgi:hypothetical protein